MANTTSSKPNQRKSGGWSKRPAQKSGGRAKLSYPNSFTLAFIDALKKDLGVDVPEGTPMPMLTTPVWSGPRDRRENSAAYA